MIPVAPSDERVERGGVVLAVNAGSSSIRFALFQRQMNGGLQRRLHGKLERIGLPGTSLTYDDAAGDRQDSRVVTHVDEAAAAGFLLDWLQQRVDLSALSGIGHRVATGGTRYVEPERVTGELLEELRRIKASAPEHLPAETALIEQFRAAAPRVPQVACFDTAFHRDLPRVARILPIPRRLERAGVRRYGFHGLSYNFLMQELARVAGTEAAQGRVLLAHLGNGASLAAVRAAQCVDTSMAFTPAAGVPMSSRSGDLDPGLVRYLEQTEGMTAEQFDHMINHESGLLGVSEISPDIRDLLAREDQDERAADAVALFCYQVKKWIGAFAAVLGGVDTLVFAGGIGENAAVVRARICEGLDFLGIEIDAARNVTSSPVISADASRVTVRVIRTDEELMIAQAVDRVLGLSGAPEARMQRSQS
jgi:acetate kinase